MVEYFVIENYQKIINPIKEERNQEMKNGTYALCFGKLENA
ncbi:hypothetical protein Cs308_0039 [Candidatus Chlamydia sanziniae]|uniref:Uncharacterized protein n=1 Tax=Candidatus Chlamydia sanziniae TaxID=1806891 RepID=A0A1A9HTQ0_9CHLA|nr:hypothetical protein Cs308_0039 [Candidatus Chlamydia sanziniae]